MLINSCETTGVIFETMSCFSLFHSSVFGSHWSDTKVTYIFQPDDCSTRLFQAKKRGNVIVLATIHHLGFDNTKGHVVISRKVPFQMHFEFQ